LIGELTSAFVTTSLGLTPTPRADHAQYIAHFVRLMKSDASAIFAAAGKAAQAADYQAAFSAVSAAPATGPSRDVLPDPFGPATTTRDGRRSGINVS
jgi:antirestriction protein ArdC